MGGFEAGLGPWVIRYRVWIILASLAFVLFAFNGASTLHFTTNYRVFFSKDNPELLAFEAIENTYAKSDNVLIVLEPDNGNVFTRENLAIIKKLTERSWQIPYSNRVDSLSNFQHTEADGDDLIVRDLVGDPSSLTDKEVKRIQEIALNEPLLVNWLVSENCKVTGINIRVQLPRINEDLETPEVVSFVRNLTAEIEREHPNIKTYITGMVMMNNSFSESAKSDIANLIPISFGLMLIILALLVGGLFGTFTTLLVIAFSIISGMGIGGYLGIPITPPSAGSPTIILTVAIANCVHILVTYYHALQIGESNHEALCESLRVNLQPVFLASATTTLGFLSMNFSEVPPFQHLGNFVAIGVITSFIMSVTLLPAIMSFLPARTKPIKDADALLMSRVGNFVVRRRTSLLWGMSALIIGLLFALPRNELNDVYVHYFDNKIQFRVDSDFTTANLTGLYNIDYSLHSGESGGISKPEFLRDVAAFTHWYEQQPEVMHVTSITDTLKRLNKNMHGDDPDMYRLPETRELAAQYLLLYEMSLPYGLDLNNQINVDKSSVKVTPQITTVSSKELLTLNDKAKMWLEENAPNIKPIAGTGTSIMFANIGQRNIRSMLVGTTVALILISIILMIALRSVKIGLISLIPNLAPAAMGFGLWGILVGEIGLSLSVVTTMTMGIVIDDTVHFLSKYLRARREKDLSAPDAVRYAFRTVGNALLITSVVLVIGFLVLSTSSFELNSGMGLLTAIVIVFALAADFLFLPPLLMKIEEKQDAQAVLSDRMSDTASS